jgi:hypothetical protein
MNAQRELPAPFAARVADNVRRHGHRDVQALEVQRVYRGEDFEYIEAATLEAIREELREYGFEPA